jgi:hypothetical protein
LTALIGKSKTLQGGAVEKITQQFEIWDAHGHSAILKLDESPLTEEQRGAITYRNAKRLVDAT